MALPNTWLLRRVADSSAKSCWICYKPSSNVLITSDNKVRPLLTYFDILTSLQDFFYVCLGHLKDRGFCVPDPSEDAAAKERMEKKAQEELEREKEKVIKEYEDRKKEREKKRKDRKDAKDKKKDKDKDKDKDKKDDEEDKKDAEEKEKKIEELAKKSEDMAAEEGPRIFNLSK
jgi:hypothetical protein